MKKGRGFFKRAKKRFYRGPKNMGAIVVPRFIGYQSVTLTFLNWLGYLINTQFTLIGRVMVLIGTLMLSYCLLGPYTFPMSYLGFSLICLYIINIIVGFIFRPQLKVQRALSKNAVCNAEVTVSYIIENTGKLPCWDLKMDAIHYPGTSKKQVVSINCLKPGETVRESSKMLFKNRGNFLLPAVFSETAFPFGLWKWGSFGSGNREVKVVPQAIAVTSMKLPFLVGENNADVLQSSQGHGMEFTSCREFRLGDNPKHIHWASWAKTGTPVIREMSDEGSPTASLLFDPCHVPNIIEKYSDTQVNFELAISLLAGICECLSRQNFCIRNFIVGQEINTFPQTRAKEIYDEILNLCADIKDTRKIEPIKLNDYMYNSIQDSKGLIVILLNWDESRKKLVTQINDNGIPCKIILLGTKKPQDLTNVSFISFQDLKTNFSGQI